MGTGRTKPFFLSLVISMQSQQLQINCLNEFFQFANRQSDFTAVTAAVTAVTTAKPSLAKIPDIQPECAVCATNNCFNYTPKASSRRISNDLGEMYGVEIVGIINSHNTVIVKGAQSARYSRIQVDE